MKEAVSRPVSHIDITAIMNPFRAFDSRIAKRVAYRPGSVIADYVGEMMRVDTNDWDIAVSVNGMMVSDPVLSIFEPKAGDNIVFCLKPHGDNRSNKQLTAMVAMVAIMVVAPYAVAAMGGAGMGFLGTTVNSLSFIGRLASASLVVAGGYLVSTMVPPPETDAKDNETSRTYGWSAAANNAEEGHSWPVLYGTAKIMPYLISRHITTDDDKQYLNMLFAVADHLVDSITDIKIDDVDIDAYSEVDVSLRYGFMDQSVIPYFNASSLEIPVGTSLDKTKDARPDFFVTTSGNQVQEVAIGITIPTGVFRVNDEGAKRYNTISIGIWYKKDDGAWTPFVCEYNRRDPATGNWAIVSSQCIDISGKTNETIRKQFRIKDLSPGQYSVAVGFLQIPNTDSQHYGHDIYWEYLQETIHESFTYPGTALLGIRALATDQLNSGMPKVTCVASRIYVSVYDPLMDRWLSRPANNPAWAAYDMLTNSFYGGSVAETRMMYNEFETWANFCTSNGYLFSIYFDSILDLVKAKSRIEIIGRGVCVQRGTDFGVIIDKQETPIQLFGEGNVIQGSFKQSFLPKSERSTLVDLTFWDAEDNYAQKIITIFGDNYNPSEPEVKSQITLYGGVTKTLAYSYAKYLLNCNQYQLRAVEFEVDIDALACTVGDVVNVSSDVPQWGYSGRVTVATANTVVVNRDITLYPGVEYSIMVRHLLDDTLEAKGISFTNSAAYNNVPSWESGEKYYVDDVRSYTGLGNFICLAEHISSVANRPGTGADEWLAIDYIVVNTLVLSSPWALVPQPDCVMSVGEINKVVKPFRILSITRSQDFRRRISGIEYIADIYTDTVDVDDIAPITALALVTGLIAKEIWDVSGGSGVSAVYLSWRGVAIYWNVFVKSEGGAWVKVATATKPSYIVYNLTPGKQYSFAVSYNNNPLAGEIATINFTGNPDVDITDIAVPDVPNLEICGQGLNTIWQAIDLPLCWTAVSTQWMNSDGQIPSGVGVSTSQTSYWLRIYHMDGSLRREVLVYDNKYIYSYGMNYADGNGLAASALIIRVWAVNQFGTQSPNFAEITVSNPAPAAVTGLSVSQFMYACRFTWNANTEPDFAHYKYRFLVGSGSWEAYQTTFSTFMLRTLSEAERVLYGNDPLITIEVIAVDSFGNESAVQTVSGYSESLNILPTDIADFSINASKMFTRAPVLEGEIWSGDAVSTVGWNAHSLYYRGIEFQIISESTTKKYIYWVCPVTDWGAPPESPVVSSYFSRDTHPGDDAILGENDFIICVNVDGSYNPAWNAIANQVIGSAYIMNGAINDAHINRLSAAKITTGQLTAAVGNNYFDVETGVLRLMNQAGTKGLSWNPATGELFLYGAIHQSLSGAAFPSPVYRGGYSATLPYQKGDMVTHNGTTWIYINNTPATGIAPSAGLYWMIYAARGIPGPAGTSGANGNGVVYRGDFVAGGTYYNNSIRRDVVKYTGHYYIYKGLSGVVVPSWVAANWEDFGAEFSSVATDILLTQDANITQRLVFGNQHITIDGVDNQIIIADEGGISGNDYVLIKQGDLSFYYWDSGSSTHKSYASLKRVETGVGAPNGEVVHIPGVFKNEPKIIVSPHSLRTYNVSAYLQSQRLDVLATDIVSSGIDHTEWSFIPRAQLVTDDASSGPFAITMDGLTEGTIFPYSSGDSLVFESVSYTSEGLPSNVRKVSVSGRNIGYFVDSRDYSLSRSIKLYVYTDGAWVMKSSSEYSPPNSAAREWFNFNLEGESTTDIQYFKLKFVGAVITQNPYTMLPYLYGAIEAVSYSLQMTSASVLADGTVDWIAIGQ